MAINSADRPETAAPNRLNILEKPAELAFALVFLGLSLNHFQNNLDSIFRSCDTAWLIKTGHYIFQHGIPATDPFSYTAAGKTLVIYQWLYTLILAVLYSSGGLWLVGLFTCAILAVIFFWLLPAMMLRQRVKPVYIFGLLTLIAAPPWFWARPQLLSFLFVAIFAILLEDYRQSGRTLQIKHWLLPLLMVLWANLHSFWFIGLAMIIVYLLADVFDFPDHGAVIDKSQRKKHLTLLGLCLLAPLVNPYGINLIAYNLAFLTQPDFGRIRELQPYLIAYPAMEVRILIYMVLAVIVIICGRRAVPTAGLILSATGICGALLFYRFVPIAILLSWPYLGLALSRLPGCADGSRSGNPRWALPAAMLSVLVAGLMYSHHFPVPNQVNFTYLNSNEKAVAFIKEHPQLKEKMFCDGAVGSSMILADLQPVFLDTRFDFYGQDFCRRCYDCLNAVSNWRSDIQAWGSRSICISNDWPLYQELRASSWLPVFDDNNCSIWLPNTAPNKLLCEQIRSDKRNKKQ